MLTLRRFLERLIDVVLPPRCLGCGVMVRRHGGYCPTCWGSLHWIHHPQCMMCGIVQFKGECVSQRQSGHP
ncbi:MAG: double zinc ribbon domain-containing protein, partial [Alphaproteobacteria bacterium]